MSGAAARAATTQQCNTSCQQRVTCMQPSAKCLALRREPHALTCCRYEILTKRLPPPAAAKA